MQWLCLGMLLMSNLSVLTVAAPLVHFDRVNTATDEYEYRSVIIATSIAISALRKKTKSSLYNPTFWLCYP